jgi:hypothetical protein
MDKRQWLEKSAELPQIAAKIERVKAAIALNDERGARPIKFYPTICYAEFLIMEEIKKLDCKPNSFRPVFDEKALELARTRHQMLSQFRGKLMGEALRSAKKKANGVQH